MNYRATAVQLAIRPAVGAAGFDAAVLAANIAHASDVVRQLAGETGSALFVLPEFSFHGWAPGVSLDTWNAASVRIPGPETDRIARLAQDTRAYVAGTLFESIPEFPGRHFLTGFLIAPDGEIVLRYRKLYALSAKTRPGDVYERWIELFGEDSLFPVVRTPLGTLAMMIAWDAQFPEVARAYTLRGADVILHPCGSARVASEHGSGIEHVREVRAFENLVYVVSANTAMAEPAPGEPRQCWPTQIVDFEGRVLARADRDGECTMTATLDLEAQRKQRAHPVRNWPSQLQPWLHAVDYPPRR